MKRITAVALALWLAAAIGPAAAQQVPEPRIWAERLLEVLVAAGPAAAHDVIAKESLYAQRDPVAVKTLLEPMAKIETYWAPAQGYELVAEKQMGTSVALLTYLVPHDTRPMVWEFDFYRRNDMWDLTSFRFTDSLARQRRR